MPVRTLLMNIIWPRFSTIEDADQSIKRAKYAWLIPCILIIAIVACFATSASSTIVSWPYHFLKIMNGTKFGEMSLVSLVLFLSIYILPNHIKAILFAVGIYFSALPFILTFSDENYFAVVKLKSQNISQALFEFFYANEVPLYDYQPSIMVISYTLMVAFYCFCALFLIFNWNGVRAIFYLRKLTKRLFVDHDLPQLEKL